MSIGQHRQALSFAFTLVVFNTLARIALNGCFFFVLAAPRFLVSIPYHFLPFGTRTGYTYCIASYVVVILVCCAIQTIHPWNYITGS